MSNLKIHHNEKLNLTQGDIQFKFDMNYDQGSEAAQIQFVLICKNVPIGSVVGFKSNTAGPNPPIELPPTKVVTYPSFGVGEVSFVPANYTCIITVAGEFSSQPPANASIELQAAYMVQGN